MTRPPLYLIDVTPSGPWPEEARAAAALDTALRLVEQAEEKRAEEAAEMERVA
jgi:hypothetical protein